ncbi:pleckstrin homology domain-containing family A member 4 [Xenentodon cancila]
MELKPASRRAQIVRMDDQDRVSQASSVATISYFPVIKECDGRVQTFGKRCQAAKRDPNCPVVIRGWLNKKDSSGLKLWKRRWFVLSNYCLYYYKDSREESVLGSIPLPSYKILFCTPRECKNRKFTFKVVHQGMRSYFFSADTQEDMLGWVRALSQSATMEPDSTINRRCSSYQDFTQIGASSETEDFPKTASEEGSPTQHHKHVSRTLSEPSWLSGGRMGRSHSEQRARRSVHHRNRSPSNRTPSPADLRRRAVAPHREEDSLPGEDTSPQAENVGAGSLTSRGQLGSRPHTPVGRVDIRPLDDPPTMQQALYYAPASPKLEFKSAPTTPVTERWQSLSKPAPIYGSVHHTPSGRRPLGKSHSTGADLLPPLPPSSRSAHAPHQPHHHHHHSHVSVCALPPAMASRPDPRELPPLRPLESDADAVLTRLCGCDKLLQSLSLELAQLQLDKDTVHSALEVSRLQVDEWRNQGPVVHEDALNQKALLQEELVTIRARMCDVSLEMEQVWSQYERMESELSVIRSHLQHVCNFGLPQEQSQAQRELWMMEDILAGLKPNRDHICLLLGLQRHHMFQSPAPHPGSPGSPTERLQSGLPMSLQDLEQVPPVRPPLPLELQENHEGMDQGHGWTETLYEGIYSYGAESVHRRGSSQPDLLNVKAQRDASEPQSSSKWVPPDTTSQSTKAEEQSSPLLITETDSDFSLSPEQRDAKLRRVERIRERVMRSAVRESATTDSQQPIKGQGKEAHQVPPDISKKQRMKGHDGSESCLDNLSRCAELQLPGATSEDKDGHQHVRKSKSQAKFGYRNQHSGRVGITKTKVKPQASPFHISSMTVYQQEGGKGFTGYSDDEQKNLEKQAAGDAENNFKLCDLKAKWFLSTNQWQEFIPLQIPTLDAPLNEKTADNDNQQHRSDDTSDSNGMSSTLFIQPSMWQGSPNLNSRISLKNGSQCRVSLALAIFRQRRRKGSKMVFSGTRREVAKYSSQLTSMRS